MSAPPPLKVANIPWTPPEEGEWTPLPVGVRRDPVTGRGIYYPPPPSKGPLKRQVAAHGKPVPGWPNIEELIAKGLSPEEIKAILDKATADAEKKEK